MSKKRKTRKQKEISAKRREAQKIIETKNATKAIYQIEKQEKPQEIKISKIIKREEKAPERLDKKYLREDVGKIAAASGIIFALEIVLFALLNRGIVSLSMFGY